MDINIALGAFPARRVEDAMVLAANANEPLFGKVSLNHVQICPQNTGVIDVVQATKLMHDFPETQFRLHANARVKGWTSKADLASFNQYPDFFMELAMVSQALNAPAYTLHAGHRANASWVEMLQNIKTLEDMFGCPIGVEGHFPTEDNRFLLSTWGEYRSLLESGSGFVLDLSHINILAHKTGVTEMGLLKELIAAETCMEVHLSANNGEMDRHDLLIEEPWWWSLLSERNSKTVIFTEGNQVRH